MRTSLRNEEIENTHRLKVYESSLAQRAGNETLNDRAAIVMKQMHFVQNQQLDNL